MVAPLALVAVVLFVGGGRPLSPVRFERTPGWHVGADSVHACPGVPRSRCAQVGSWAATIRWRDRRDSFHRTATALPRDGVSIYVMLGDEAAKPWQIPMRWPPVIRPRDVHGSFEGLQGRGYFGRAGRLRGFFAQLFVSLAVRSRRVGSSPARTRNFERRTCRRAGSRVFPGRVARLRRTIGVGHPSASSCGLRRKCDEMSPAGSYGF
jgi:hypothetical protein